MVHVPFIMIGICIVLLVISLNPRFYNPIFNRREWLYWKFILKHLDKLEFKEAYFEPYLGKDHRMSGHINNVRFRLPGLEITYWLNDECGQHVSVNKTNKTRDCVATHFCYHLERKVKAYLKPIVESSEEVKKEFHYIEYQNRERHLFEIRQDIITYLQEALKKENPRTFSQRTGQYVFNKCQEKWPEEVKIIKETDNDCFYHDERVTVFIKTLAGLIYDNA